MQSTITLPQESNNRFNFKALSQHRDAIVTAICLLFIVLAWIAGKNGAGTVSIILYILAYISGGFQQAIEGVETLVKEKDLDVDLLMVVAAIGAACIGHWMDGALLIFIFSLSGTLEGYTMEKTNKDIRSIMKLRPENAVVLENGNERKVKVDDLQPGNIILVRPGERIAADGIITQGYSAIDQSSITGEGIPVDKKQGDDVFAGMINGQGALHIEVSKPAQETVLAKIIYLVQEAQNQKPPNQLFVERFEGVYAKVVVVLAVLLMTLPHFVLHWTWSETIYRAMIFLVVASPCALVASIMPAVLCGISNAARKGVLFKGGAHLENAAGIKVVAFDKTGTLTFGKPEITDVLPFGNYTDAGLLQLAASVESYSEHPIAKTIVETAKKKGLLLDAPQDVQAMHGIGVSGMVKGTLYRIGKKEILNGITLPEAQVNEATRLKQEGKTVVFIVRENESIGLLTVQDTLRPQAKKVVEELKALGIKTALLTGDSLSTADAIGKQAGIEEIYADLLPEHKSDAVKKLTEKYGKVAMVGDGVNDAPAMAAATLGIAMGAGGTDVAMETADVILMSDNIENIPFALKLGKRATNVIRQNVVFAILVALTLVTLNFIGGIINLPEGVVGHEGSTVLVILSGLRLLR